MKENSSFRMALLWCGVLWMQDSGAQDYTRWNLPDGALARLGKGSVSGAVVYSPDGTRLAVPTGIGIWLYDALTLSEPALLMGHSGPVHSVSFSPDGTTLASGSWDGTILLWDMSPYISSEPTTVESAPPLPVHTALLANYPNPFNNSTQIVYSLAAAGPVRLEIYNALGQQVRILVDEFQGAGVYHVTWDARDQWGSAVAAGVYVTLLRHAQGVETRRLLYLK